MCVKDIYKEFKSICTLHVPGRFKSFGLGFQFCTKFDTAFKFKDDCIVTAKKQS